MSGVLSRLALRAPRRLLKGLVSGVGLALALAIGSPLLAGIGVTLPTLGSALATCPTATFASSLGYGPAYTQTGIIQVTFSATTGTTGCQMAYHILATGGLTTSWGDYHFDDYNPAFGAPNPPARMPTGVAFNVRPAAQGVVHWYYNYRECAQRAVYDKSWVASIYFAVSVDNGPCSGEANTNTNWVFDDHTVIYDNVAPVSTTAGGAPTYSSSRSVGVTYMSTSDASSGVASVSVYRTLSATPATTDALCGTDTTPSPPTAITCATTADGLWHFYSRATDKAGNVEALPTAADDTTIVDTVFPGTPNGTLTAQNYATQAAVNGIVYFNGNTATSFTITSTGTDAAPSSGIASNTFSAPAVTTGWTTTTAATVAGNPSARAYTWTAAAVSTSITLKTTDNATWYGPLRTITLTDDSTAPAVGISAPATDTQNTLVSPAFTFTLSDAGSGVDVAASNWRRRWTTLAANVCGTTWTDEAVTFVSTGGSPAQAAMVSGRCYDWIIVARDNVYNSAAIAYSNVIKVDTVAPVFNGFTVPSANPTYTSATSATFTWNAGTDTLSGVNAYQRVWQSAPVTSPGVCGAFGNLSDHGLSTALTITEAGFANGTCYKEAVSVVDNAGNYSGWAYSNPYLIDTLPPPTTISTSTPCVSPGGQATFTVGRTDPSPSSGWLTSLDASTSWWLESFDGPWTGAYRLDPWPGNTNASATFNIGYPAPTVGTQAAYTRVVWTRDHAGNTTDSTVPLAQGRGTGIDVTVDNTAPSSPSLTVPAYAAGPVSLSFGATGGGCKGVDQVRISNDGTNWWNSSGYLTSYTGWDLANTTYGGSTTQGTRTVYIAFHEAGTSNWTQTSRTLTYDTVAPSSPVTTGTGTGVYQSGSTYFIRTAVAGTMNLSSTATDATSGMQGIYYGGGAAPAGWTYVSEWGVGANPYTNTISWIANPAGTWGTMPTVQSVDKAGNNGPSPSLTITPDNTPPVVTWTNPTADVYDTTGTVTPAWTVTDTGSGVSSAGKVTRYYLPTLSANVCSGDLVNDGFQTSGTPTTLISGRCYYWTFTTRPTDNVGNETSANLQSSTIKVDTVHPTGDLTFDDTSGVTHSRFINASVTMEDANSGPLQVRFSTDGGFSWTAWTAYVVSTPVTPTVTPLTLASGTGTYTVLAQIQDLAGNMTPLGHSTALLNEVIMPTLGAAAKIYDCANLTTLLATNTTGTIYWPVDRDLCLVPTARLVTPGSDGTNTPPLIGTISDPSGNTIAPYTLRAPDPDEMVKAPVIVWPTVGPHPVDNAMLRFTFGRETSSLSTSTPYITVPYDTVVTVVWGDNVRSEQVTVALNLRIVVKNSGTTGTQ